MANGGRFTAKACCIVAYYASCAGIGTAFPAGLTKRMALHPHSQTGQYKPHLDRALGLKELDERLYSLKIPGSLRHEAGRVVHDVPVLNPHEVLFEEIIETPEFAERLEKLVAEEKMPAAYMKHPVAVSTNHKAHPVVLYVDGVPHAKHDSMLGVWCYHLFSLSLIHI